MGEGCARNETLSAGGCGSLAKATGAMSKRQKAIVRRAMIITFTPSRAGACNLTVDLAGETELGTEREPVGYDIDKWSFNKMKKVLSQIATASMVASLAAFAMAVSA